MMFGDAMQMRTVELRFSKGSGLKAAIRNKAEYVVYGGGYGDKTEFAEIHVPYGQPVFSSQEQQELVQALKKLKTAGGVREPSEDRYVVVAATNPMTTGRQYRQFVNDVTQCVKSFKELNVTVLK